MLKKWEDLPKFMQNDAVRSYYDHLSKRVLGITIKRVFDLITATILLIVFALPMLLIALMIKLDDGGPVFYRQKRVTSYGKVFRIHKFRTMIVNADKAGSLVTVYGDNRITRVGAMIRNYRLDELPQLLDIISGNMSFVGTRPEVINYVREYSDEMYATLLLPAGLTSEASIRYKDESALLDAAENVDEVYIHHVLPGKMKYNLESIKKFSFARDILTMIRTALAMLGKQYD